MNNGTRGDEDRDHNRDLNSLVCRDAERAIVVDLSGCVGVGDLQDAREQHKGHTDNPNHRNEGMPWPAP